MNDSAAFQAGFAAAAAGGGVAAAPTSAAAGTPPSGTVITIDQALTDPHLLGAALGDPAPWSTWLAVLKATFGLRLSRSERRAFASVAGSRKPPARMVRELWAVCGRRSGKSRMAAAIGVFIACFVPHVLAAGEIGVVLLLAASKAQAAVVRNYCAGFLQASPVLAQQVENVTAETIALKGNIAIEIHSASYRTTRGRTLIAVVGDETSFWRDEASAQPDVEIYRAVLPPLISSGGIFIAISTGYRKVGLLYSKWRDHFGRDDADVLVVAGATTTFNPTIDRRVIDAAQANDPEAADAEWGGGFRSDITTFLGDTTIDAAIDDARPTELPPVPGVKYGAFADPSGGRHDAFTLCIGHKDGDRYIADVIRGRTPPFNPKDVVAEYAALAKEYGCREITADHYSAAWAESEFRAAGITLKRSDKPASQLYIESLPLFMRGVVSIPNHPRLVRELRLLERRTSRSGRDVVDHGRNGFDDHAASLAGMLRSFNRRKGEIGWGIAHGIFTAPSAPQPQSEAYRDGDTIRIRFSEPNEPANSGFARGAS
jgi:hypothetical protein